VTHTVTIVADHKGFTTPRVSGDEYFVDANINITAYVQNGITVTASSLGLGSITAVLVTGVEEETHTAQAVLTSAGDYLSTTTFKLLLNAGNAEQSGTSDEGMVRVRVYGNL
tara:strand:+ start:6140 stop:6475 length:336 start_codon:yes stop_codon:yes gene_type:complete